MHDNTPRITPLIQQPDDMPTAAERDAIKRQLADKLRQLAATDSAAPLPRARLQLDIAELLLALARGREAWDIAREAFVAAMRQESWQDAAEACDVLYQCAQRDSLAVLGMGIWLAVTFPVESELTLALLIHLVDATPDNSDAAALAAITARYVVDLRADDAQLENQRFLADKLLAVVAERHGKVRDQLAMDRWLDKLQLRDPQRFLPRMALAIEALVGDNWWFERDVLRDRLPD